MNRNKPFSKILAWILTAVMIVGTLPVAAGAADLPAGAFGEIIAFEPLADEVSEQTVPFGTELSALILPETLTATVRSQVYTSGSALEITETPGDLTEEESGETVEPTEPEILDMELDVPVTWTSAPNYDGEISGGYVFTAMVSGFYVLAEPPVITVTVEEAALLPADGEGTVTAFAELPEDIRFQRGYAPNLPDTVEGTVEVETVQIPVSWHSEEYDSLGMAGGLAVFTAKPAEGYITADGVGAPTIAFMRESMLRMGGAGTWGDPLQIVNAAQLAEIAALVNTGKLEQTVFGVNTGTVYLKLMNDIDLSAYGTGTGWTPIGINSSYSFKGQFDGNGHTVSGLYINRTDEFTGLFGVVGSGAMVQNLGVVNAEVKGASYVGGVAGDVNGGTVQNCYATGSVTGNESVGGVAGYVSYSSTVQNCYATGSVSGNEFVGGVVGYVSYSGTVVENCYATGSVTGNIYVGGVVGRVSSGTVKSCAALNPSVSGTSSVGRVIGSGTGTDNYAYSGMLNKAGTTTWSGNALTHRDGFGKTANEIAASATLFDLFADTTVWTTETGSLPGLFSAAVPMPAHLLDTGANPFDGGDGESGSPYKISTAEQLAALAQLVNGSATNATWASKYYKLTADIDLSTYGTGEGWTPIGIDITNSFKGQFDGDNHTVSGLYINSTDDNIGLFGYVMNSAVVQNLGVVNANVSGNDSVGGVAGQVFSSTVKNCYVTGSVTGTGNFVGGVAGYVSIGGTVQNCYATGSVTGNNYVGGVAGSVTGSSATTVQNCYATGSVRGTTYVGGVAGEVDGGTVQNCYATGSVTGTGSFGFVGGVVGYVRSGGGTVKNCAALNPSVSGISNMGRVVGYNNGGAVTNNYAYSFMDHIGSGGDDGIAIYADDIAATSFWTYTGNWDGLVWDVSVWTIENNKLPGLFGKAVTMPVHLLDTGAHPFDGGNGTELTPYEISTAAQLAWLAERVNEGSNAYADADVYYELTADIDLSAYGASFNSGKGWIPIGTYNNPFQGKFDGGGHTVSGLYINAPTTDFIGLFGVVESGATVQKLGVVNAEVKGNTHVGGVVGIIDGGTVQNCYATGSVSGSGNVEGEGYVGGVAGQVLNGKVQNCYATGSVSGTGHYVGGVAGQVLNGTVQNCYATGSVSGTGSAVGGVVGLVANSTVQNCYATGSINGNNYVGGVAGYVYNSTVQNCAALNPLVSGTSDVGRVVGYNTGGTVANNYAYSGMSCVSKGTSYDNGAAMTASAAHKASFWTTTTGNWSGWDNSTVWTIVDDYLPILTGLNGQDGGSGMYLTTKTIEYAVISGRFTYNGSAFWPTVTLGGVTLTKDTDYTISVTGGTSAGTNVGTVEVTIEGKGNYTGTKNGSYEIEPKSLTSAMIADISPLTYTGSAQSPAITVADGGTPLVPNTDYETVVYSNNTNAGTASVSITGKGNYSGTVSKNFTINKATLTINAADSTVTAKEYDGAATANIAAVGFTGLQNSETLTLGTDYTVTDAVFNSANVADAATVTATVALTGSTTASNYTLTSGAFSKSETITPAPPITGHTVSRNVQNEAVRTIVIPLTALQPDPGTGKSLGVVSYALSSYTSGAGNNISTDAVIDTTNLTITSKNNNVGFTGTETITVNVTTQNYGVCVVTVELTAVDKQTVTISGLSIASRDYSGSAHPGVSGLTTPTFTTNPDGQTVVPDNKTLTVLYTGTDNAYSGATPPTNAGSYSVIASLDNDAAYIGTWTASFSINKANQTALTVDAVTGKKMGDAPFALTSSGGSGTGTVSFTLVSGPATLSGDTLTITGAGDIVVTAAKASDNNYNSAASVQRTITIAKAAQAALTVTDPGEKTYGTDTTVTLSTAGGSGAGTVSYTVVSGPGTLNGNTLTITGAGSIVVKATKAADSDYEAATSADFTITVNKANQAALSVNAVTGKKFSDSLFALSTSGGSGTGAVSYTVVSGPGTVSGNTLTITGVGSIIVTATKAADSNYNATTSTQQTITIAKGDAPVVATQTVSIFKQAASNGNTVNISALLPTNKGNTTYTITSSPGTDVENEAVSAIGVLTFDTKITAATSENITVQAAMDNYETVIITVTVNFTDKKVPVVTPSVSGSMSYGQPLSTLSINKTAVVDGSVNVPGTITWDAPASKPAVGAPAQAWTFTPTDTALYEKPSPARWLSR